MKKIFACFKLLFLNKTSIIAFGFTILITIIASFTIAQMGGSSELNDPTIYYIGWVVVISIIQLIITYSGATYFMSVTDNRDDNIIQGLNTTPLPGQKYILYQGIGVTLFSILMGIIIVIVASLSIPMLNQNNIIYILIGLILSSPLVIVITYFGMLVTNNKIGSYAFMKMGLIVFLVNLVPVFLAMFEVNNAKIFEWMFYIIPGTLSNMYLFSIISNGFNITTDTFMSANMYLILGVIVLVFQLAVLYKLTKRKLLK